MGASFTSRRSPVGLDVGARTVAAAQLTYVRGGCTLEASALVDRPVGAGAFLKDEEAVRIAQVLRRQGFTGHDVVLAVPDQRLVGGGAATLELPPRSSGAPLEQLARMELSRAHRLDPSSFEMSCWEVPGPARAAEAAHMMAVACRHADANELIDGLEMNGRSGLRVSALDAHAWAIARACRGALKDDEKIAAVVDLTESTALLAIIHNGAPAYERLLADGGLDHLRRAIQARLRIDSALADHLFEHLCFDEMPEEDGARETLAAATEHMDNLASELRTALAYAEHRFDAGLGRVLLQGSGAAIPGIEARLSMLLKMPAQALRPADVLSCRHTAASPEGGTGAAAEQNPALMAAVGLAMHKGVAA